MLLTVLGILPFSPTQAQPPPPPPTLTLPLRTTPPTTAPWIKPTYLVVTPKVLRRGIDLEIGVCILYGLGPVTVTAKVTKKGQTYVGTATIAPGTSAVIAIPIPASADEGVYTLTVSGSGGLRFKDTTTLTLDPHSVSVFIQTDKAIYKPGQEVKFRVFGIKPDCSPLDEPLDIFISDKNNNKIKQWLNQKETSGVISKSLQLSD
ncbi:unnamed protein product, partial [Owenia fusiformis]